MKVEFFGGPHDGLVMRIRKPPMPVYYFPVGYQLPVNGVYNSTDTVPYHFRKDRYELRVRVSLSLDGEPVIQDRYEYAGRE